MEDQKMDSQAGAPSEGATGENRVVLPESIEDELPSARYLPYPSSTLSPRILPTDLTSIKTRGVSAVERFFQTRLSELHREYEELVDRFNWNKLIYEARFGFEPAIGSSYHLYRLRDGYTLSMIEPQRWPGKRWIGTFRLQADGQWSVEEVAEDFDLRAMVGENDASEDQPS